MALYVEDKAFQDAVYCTSFLRVALPTKLVPWVPLFWRHEDVNTIMGCISNSGRRASLIITLYCYNYDNRQILKCLNGLHIGHLIRKLSFPSVILGYTMKQLCNFKECYSKKDDSAYNSLEEKNFLTQN